jgi:hypothetical protein
MNITEIATKLEDAGCTVRIWKDSRIYVAKTPNGGKGDYGYCVESEDVRDICENITKRNGEIAAILRA